MRPLRLLFTLSSSTFEKKKIQTRERESERQLCSFEEKREDIKVFGFLVFRVLLIP